MVRKNKIVLLSALLFVFAAAYAGWTYYSHLHPSTDDAYVKAHVVRIAPQVTGIINDIHVDSYQNVHKGEVLFTIDRSPFEIALHKAQAQLQQASQGVESTVAKLEAANAETDVQKALLADARKEWNRIGPLAKKGIVSQSSRDKALATLQQTQAAYKAAQETKESLEQELGENGHNNPHIQEALADVDAARLNLSYTTVMAPVDGVVGEVNIRPGSTVSTNQETLQIVDTGIWWVDANFKETNLGRIRIGQPADITIDMLPDNNFQGTVEKISPASGTAMSLFPPENATGNWVKVTRRFPVRVMITETDQNKLSALRMGASASITVNTAADNIQDDPHGKKNH